MSKTTFSVSLFVMYNTHYKIEVISPRLGIVFGRQREKQTIIWEGRQIEE
jgi:hypothetical protein